ncbi:hypothetical protein D3C81_2074810 [compost metagenome]
MRHILTQRNVEIQPFLLGFHCKLQRQHFRDFTDIEFLVNNIQLARFYLGQIKNIINKR